MRTSRRFPPDPGSVPSARRFVLQAAGNAPADLRDAIAVMTAELAMNAVQHARTEFEVTVDLAGGTLRVEVTDSGHGQPAAAPMPPPESPRGRGLAIVDGLADAWGIISSRHDQGNGIWFQIAVPAAAAQRKQDQGSTQTTRGSTGRRSPRPGSGRQPRRGGPSRPASASWRRPVRTCAQ
jgi:anti-sigma regulatory factor (Ser/Thr protein kinase)